MRCQSLVENFSLIFFTKFSVVFCHVKLNCHFGLYFSASSSCEFCFALSLNIQAVSQPSQATLLPFLPHYLLSCVSRLSCPVSFAAGLGKVSFWLFSIQRFSYLYSYDSDPAKTCPKVRILDYNTLPVCLTNLCQRTFNIFMLYSREES